MSYLPLWRILAWPPDSDRSEPGTELSAGSGSVPVDMHALVRTGSFVLPRAPGTSPDDYAATELCQRGSLIKIEVTDDGSFTGEHVRTIFDGSVTAVITDPQVTDESIRNSITVKVADRLQKARGNGINMSRQTRMQLLDIEFTSADFDSSDPNFLVNIPTDETTLGYEFVPKMLFNLSCTYEAGGETVTVEYVQGQDYEYGANRKLIYFKSSQEEMLAGSGVWTCRLYYYDPTDLTNTVKKILTAVATGLPHSAPGGLGIPEGEIDLEEITGWGSSPKVVRSIIREKVDGPVTQFYDELRENGILPVNYWQRIDPETRFLKGSYVYQAAEDIPLPVNGVIDYSRETTIEAVYGRVEHYGLAMTPENFARNATAAINCPADYTVILPGSTGEEVIDGRADTVCNFQRTGKSLGAGYMIHRTDDDAWVITLNEPKPIRTIMFRGALPIDEDWDPPQPHNLRHLERNARITISASLDPITSSNPGIPVSDQVLGFELDALNTEEWHQFDCDLIHEARYIVIRGDQDAFARISPDYRPTATRTSWFPCGEVKILGDGRHRYNKIEVDGVAYDHPDKGQVPYAEIKGDDDVATVTAVPVAGTEITLSNLELAERLETAGFAQVKAGESDPVLVRVTARVDATITISPAVAGVAIGDPVGEYNRWLQDFSGTWHDLYFPKLRVKLANTTDWLEIIDDDAVSELADAQCAALERLIEGITITTDYRMEIPLDLNLEVGGTTRPYADEDAFLITKCEYQLNSVYQGEKPAVTQVIEGTDYLKAGQ